MFSGSKVPVSRKYFICAKLAFENQQRIFRSKMFFWNMMLDSQNVIFEGRDWEGKGDWEWYRVIVETLLAWNFICKPASLKIPKIFPEKFI